MRSTHSAAGATRRRKVFPHQRNVDNSSPSSQRKACEDALLDSTALRRFVGIDLGRERVPDATTLLKFRRLLETHQLGEALFPKSASCRRPAT